MREIKREKTYFLEFFFGLIFLIVTDSAWIFTFLKMILNPGPEPVLGAGITIPGKMKLCEPGGTP